jgi:hypothetical protein
MYLVCLKSLVETWKILKDQNWTENKTIMGEVKNPLDGINGILDFTEQKT